MCCRRQSAYPRPPNGERCTVAKNSAALCEAAHGYGLRVHMDGARFANAVAHLACTPAEASWRCGVDVLSFGATKNGALAAEAVIFFKPDLAREFEMRRKRAGHLWSKMRFLSAQLNACLENELWLRNGRHANALATRLALGLRQHSIPLMQPVEANEVFAALPQPLIDALRAQGFRILRMAGASAPGLAGRAAGHGLRHGARRHRCADRRDRR